MPGYYAGSHVQDLRVETLDVELDRQRGYLAAMNQQGRELVHKIEEAQARLRELRSRVANVQQKIRILEEEKRRRQGAGFVPTAARPGSPFDYGPWGPR
jgi:DNA repair exonuclease SbcCD ATPase subunit